MIKSLKKQNISKKPKIYIHKVQIKLKKKKKKKKTLHNSDKKIA